VNYSESENDESDKVVKFLT